MRKGSLLEKCLLCIFLLLIQGQMTGILYKQAIARRLNGDALERMEFRRMQLSEETLQFLKYFGAEVPSGELLTILSAKHAGNLAASSRSLDEDSIVGWKQFLTRYNREGYDKIARAYGAIWNDLVCFPVAEAGMVFENSWMFERTYGGRRGHEGTDIIPPQNLRGHYRVISMTDGVVEQVGWLPQGGYRIGIRTPHGGYFYYAHLDSYSREYQIGDKVSAGEVLGRMGDSGYGEEGTKGQFDAHLHLGIYIRTEQSQELSVNPYWVLRYLGNS